MRTVYYPYYPYSFCWSDIVTTVTIVGIITVFVVGGVYLLLSIGKHRNSKSDNVTIPNQSMFTVIEDNDIFCIVYHKQTKVMYAIAYGSFTLLVDENNKPMIYKEKEI